MEDRRGQQAAERARTALVRATELSDRLAELREGNPGHPLALEQAIQAAYVATDRAAFAAGRAAEAHHKAAELHRRLADMYAAADLPDRAAQHRRLAALDDAKGDADERLAARPHVRPDGLNRPLLPPIERAQAR